MCHLHQITQHRIANLLRGAVRKNRACFLFQCSQFVIQRIIFLIGKNFPVLLIICLRRPVQLLHQLLYSLCHIASLTVSAYSLTLISFDKRAMNFFVPFAPKETVTSKSAPPLLMETTVPMPYFGARTLSPTP